MYATLLSRVVRSAVVVGAGVGVAFVTGCGGASYAHERNPSFAEGRMAPAPVATYPVMNCSGSSNRSVDDTLRAVLERRGYRGTGASVAAAPDVHAQLCNFVRVEAPEEASLVKLGNGSRADSWRVPNALAATIQKLSQANGAASNVFLVAQQVEACSSTTQTMADSQGRTEAQVQNNELVCTNTPQYVVHSLVFNAKSELLWNGSEQVSTDRANEMSRSLQALVQRIPAALGEGDAVSTTTTTSAQVANTKTVEPAAAPEAAVPSDVPIALLGGKKTGFRQSSLKGNSKTGYSLAMLEGIDGGKSEIQALIRGKLMTGRPMPVTVSSMRIKDSTCTATGTLTISSLPALGKVGATPKVVGAAAGTLSLTAQCPDGNTTVEGPIKAEVTVQR